MQMDDDLEILLIEDDEDVADVYRTRLEADGYRVTIARDGKDGLERAMTDHPDLIFVDLRLPGFDGFEVIRRLRAESSTTAIPVVILTNYDEPELRQRGLSLGVLEFLIKTDTSPAQLSEHTLLWLETPETPESAG